MSVRVAADTHQAVACSGQWLTLCDWYFLYSFQRRLLYAFIRVTVQTQLFSYSGISTKISGTIPLAC